MYEPRPRYQCPTCEDWGIYVAPGGKGTIPCPCRRPNTTTSSTGTTEPQSGGEQQ